MYKPVKLNIDGYNVTACLMQEGIYKNVICLYINGVIDWKWLTEDCEERRRFMKISKKCLFRSNELKKLPKKIRDTYKEDNTYESYDFRWNSFRALKKHLIDNNKDIELIKID